MKQATLYKLILWVLFALAAVFVFMSLYNWGVENYQPQHDRLEAWARVQSFRDHKWAWDSSKVAWIALLTSGEVLLLWAIANKAYRGLLKKIIANEGLGPGIAIPIAGITLLGMTYLGLEIYQEGPFIAWITGPSNVAYPGQGMSHYFFFSLGPAVAAIVIGISIFLFTLVESGRYALKAK